MKLLKRAGLLVSGLPALTALMVFAFSQTGSASAASVQSDPLQRAYEASAAQTTSTVAGLAGTNWLLSSLDGEIPLVDSNVTLQFGDDGNATGSDGCNQFIMAYTQDGQSLTFGAPGAPGISTLIACQADIMTQATAFTDALTRTTTFSSNRRQLILQEGNQILAAFTADSQELDGTSWEVTAYNNGRDAVVSLIVGTDINIDFGVEGLVTGNAGCNDYFSNFVAADGKITVDAPAATFRACPYPPGVMEQEAEFLTALAGATTYSVSGNTMQMRTADDQLAMMLTRRHIVDLPAPEYLEAIPWGRATAPNGLNIRSGPGTNFPVIAVARNGDEAEIVGRSADSRWWVISLPTAPTGIGWVSADFVLAMNIANVPVVEAPPAPAPTPIPTAVPPTPVPPATATPQAQISFSADQTNINQGDCTTLRWSAQNVEAIWINPQNDLFDRTPRPSQGSQQVCPAATTTYEMRVQLRDGNFDLRSVTINVAASQQPQISFWADRTTIDQGQCTRLHWSVENIQGVWVYPQGERYDRFPRVGNDSEQVCPNRTTTYEMRVLQRDNSTVFRTVTINVNAAATPTPAGNPLAGTNWNIVQFNNGSNAVTTLLTNTHANANFGSGGQLSGNAGCNNFTGSYQVNGNNISVGQTASQSKLCTDPDGIMDQEHQILTALQSAATFTISGNQLEMRTAGGQIALILTR